MGVDRFADNFPNQSPYVYAANNPIKFIDVNGDFKFDKKTLNILNKYKYVKAFLTSPQGIALRAKNLPIVFHQNHRGIGLSFGLLMYSLYKHLSHTF